MPRLQTRALDCDQEDWEASSCCYLQYKMLTFYKLKACLHENKKSRVDGLSADII